MRPVFAPLLILLVVLGACSPLSPLGDVEQHRGEISPLQPEISPIPTPTVSSVAAPAVEEEIIPTRDPSKGVIEGSIAMDGQPVGVLPATLFLGDPTGSEPLGAYVALDTQTAPRGYLRPDGTFVFPNVLPGLYTIVVWTPNGSYLVPDPSTGHTWLIEIKPGADFRTGHIRIPAQGAS